MNSAVSEATPLGRTWLRVSVARSLIKVAKLCTGCPSAVNWVWALRVARGERWAGATIDARKAAAPAGSFSAKSRGASRSRPRPRPSSSMPDVLFSRTKDEGRAREVVAKMADFHRYEIQRAALKAEEPAAA